ncbi:MAG TPA: tRNA 2-thiocytidine(32) synthetase TtcA [Polyangia bacterium]|nr:tRNA 2-thiocytidine(32) synthetase TtcA [Polyangia bacterium]
MESPADPRDPLAAEPEAGGFRFRSKIEMRIQRKVGEAIRDWQLLEDGDRVMVCVSGGKDSYALLDMMLLLRRRAPISFEVVAVNVDQGWPGYDTAQIEAHLKSRGTPYRMVNAESIAAIVEEKLAPDATPCSLCSRLRRGVLYNLAAEMGCTKIALGHHLDDSIETLLLNLFFSGQLRAMPPKLVSDDGRNVVIRPLTYVEEKDLITYAAERTYPVVRCGCPTCGLPDQQRQIIKRWLSTLSAEHPGLKTQMLAAMENVRPGHLFDRQLLARLGLGPLAAGGDGRARSQEGGSGKSEHPEVTDRLPGSTSSLGHNPPPMEAPGDGSDGSIVGSELRS